MKISLFCDEIIKLGLWDSYVYYVVKSEKEAEKMLITGKYSVTDVAYNVGFSDPRYFSKCFKELYNVTPSDFIKKYLDISS